MVYCSSRRRHTRFDCDWSSDVCSSDLALLTEALRQAGRCGVGRWAARGRGYLVILRPIGDVLAMQQLHYAADVRRASEVEIPKPEVKPAELKLAQQLIDQQTAEKFDADSYKDELRG